MTITVYPGATNPSHDFSLSDGVQTWGLRLDAGPESLREEPLTPSTLRFVGGNSAFGAWEPGMVQIEQRDWSGGRGAQRFSAEDALSSRRFYDSMHAWTLTPGMLLPAPQWKLARGLRNAVHHLPGSMQWQGLFAEQRYLAARFNAGSVAFSPAKVRVWLRRVGSPGALSLALYEDEDGLPAAALPDGGVLTITDVPDTVSLFRSFDVSAYGENLLSGIDYHIVLTASPTDNAANHWEIGVDKDYDGGHVSRDGAAWTGTKFCAYHRVEDAGTGRPFLFFQFAGAFYAVDQRFDGSPSHLYLNGDRGLATSGTPSTLEDADKTWAADQWAGAWVRIRNGKGAGQLRQIVSNSAMELVIDPWDQVPDATSEYVIYASDLWRDISPTSGDLFDGVVTDVLVVDDQVWFALGASVPILHMRFNNTLAVPAHEFDDDGTNVADQLHVFHHSTAGPQIWRTLAANSEVSRATPTAWGTALTFGPAIKVGDKSAPILELFDFSGQLWVLKSTGGWTIDEADKAHETSLDLSSRNPSPSPMLTEFDGKLVIGLGFELLQYDGTLSSIGIEHAQFGSSGQISGLRVLNFSRLAIAIDAGDEDTSSLIVLQNGTWHEIFRAPETGMRIQGIALQHCPCSFSAAGSRPRLWINLGGDLAWIELSRDTGSPLGDPSSSYQHEAVLVSSTVDMGAALLPKFLKQLTLWTAHLTRGRQVNVDFQVDGQIGSNAWRSAGAVYSSPLESLPLQAGPLHAIRTRLRLLSDQANVPAVVQSVILDRFARTPLKYQWTLRVRLADLQADYAGGLDSDPDAFMLWLQDAARRARKIHMRSIWQALDDRYVIVEPPTLQREYINETQWGGTATVVLREA
jgi:hypothetical protein